MRYKLISCDVFYREMCWAASRSPNMVDVEFLPKGLHDMPAGEMLARMQAAVDSVDESKYDAIVLGYALCNNGLAGLQARGIPVVLPRAHDCITLFLGSHQRYIEYFNSHPGVYFKTTGWIERGEATGELSQLSIQRKTGMDYQYEQLVAKYGEENARYLFDTLCDHTKNYTQFTFIEMGIEPDGSYEQRTRDEAQQKGWKFEKVRGDISLIQRLVDGKWDDAEVLVIPPSRKVAGRYDDSVIGLEEE